jgi:hypothetical protein
MGIDQRDPPEHPGGRPGAGAEIACGSKEFESPPFPFPPPGASRGGRVPPTPEHVARPAKSAGTRHAPAPPTRGAAAPLWIPCLESPRITADGTMKA